MNGVSWIFKRRWIIVLKIRKESTNWNKSDENYDGSDDSRPNQVILRVKFPISVNPLHVKNWVNVKSR